DKNTGHHPIAGDPSMLDERAPAPAAQHGRTKTGGTLSRTVGKRPDRHALPDGCDAQCFEVL
ncbi:hypothetical protein, partial [Pseudomonas sp. FG-3G]